MHISKEPIQRDYQMNRRTLNVVQTREGSWSVTAGRVASVSASS